MLVFIGSFEVLKLNTFIWLLSIYDYLLKLSGCFNEICCLQYCILGLSMSIKIKIKITRKLTGIKIVIKTV